MRAGRTAKRIRQEAAAKRQSNHKATQDKYNQEVVPTLITHKKTAKDRI